MRTEAPVLAPVFRSDGQARLLSAFLVPGGDELSIVDAAARADVAYGTAHAEIGRLLDAGILTERRAGRTRLIRENPASPLVEPLRTILLVVSGPAVLLREELAAVPGVERAFIFGSFAARAHGVAGADPSDIDVMVIGDVDAPAVYDAVRRVEERVSRPVNPTILTADEFAESSGFLDSVRSGPVVPVIGGAG